MTLEECLQEIEILKKELDSLRPIQPLRLHKIMQKFRLDWNYHSNSIEGNQLTYGETRLLLLHGITAKGKPLKDHLDIQGHNEALLFLEGMIQNNEATSLSHSFIKHLHQMILKESYTVFVEDFLGQRIPKTIQVGQYKTSPNHVRTAQGEIFYFAEPYEVQPRMTDLLEWYEKEAFQKLHPLLVAAEFHYRFILIHPFDDGNGRLARILMNLILMKQGFAPVIVKTESKQDYYKALREADGGNLESFLLFMGNELKRTMAFFRFDEFHYSLVWKNQEKMFSKLYHQSLKTEEIANITKLVFDEEIGKIEQWLDKK